MVLIYNLLRGSVQISYSRVIMPSGTFLTLKLLFLTAEEMVYDYESMIPQSYRDSRHTKFFIFCKCHILPPTNEFDL